MRFTCALGVVVVLASLAGCGKPAADQAAAAASAPAARSAATLLIAPEDLLTLGGAGAGAGPVVTGSIQPERRADLRAEVAAIVREVFKENGESVRAGDLLMRLDDTAIRDALVSADESVRALMQAFDQAERQYQRMKTLQAQGMMSTQAAEDAEIRRNNLQSDLVGARAKVVQARQQLQRTSVRAPFDGIVSERRVSSGDTVQVGRELVKVIDPRSMRFEGLVSADRLQEIALGQPVRFRINGYPQAEFGGSVRRIDASADAMTRQVEVLVTFADPAAAPRVAGLYAEGRIAPAAGARPALSLPESAVVRSGGQAVVWQLAGGTVRKVPVSVGARDPRSGEVPVSAGIAAGAQVLRNPGSTLVDGQKAELAGAARAASAVAANNP